MTDKPDWQPIFDLFDDLMEEHKGNAKRQC
jgi:hypothetical protein